MLKLVQLGPHFKALQEPPSPSPPVQNSLTLLHYAGPPDGRKVGDSTCLQFTQLSLVK